MSFRSRFSISAGSIARGRRWRFLVAAAGILAVVAYLGAVIGRGVKATAVVPDRGQAASAARVVGQELEATHDVATRESGASVVEAQLANAIPEAEDGHVERAMVPGDKRQYPYDLQRESFWVRIVASEDGGPVAGAEIWALDDYENVAQDTERFESGKPIAITGADGLAAVQMAPVTITSASSRNYGSSSFVVLARGRARGSFNQQLMARTPERAHEVALAMAADLEIVVVDPTGHPLDGVDVQLALAFDDSADKALTYAARLWGWRTGFQTVRGVTDRFGRALFDKQSSGVEVRVKLLAPGFGAGWQHHGALPSALVPGERRVQTIVARMPVDVSGVAVDETGLPVAGVELILVLDEGQFEGVVVPPQLRHGQPSAVTSGDGAFLFKGVAVGRWLAVPRGPDAGPKASGSPPVFAPFPTSFEVTGIEPELALEIELRIGHSLHGLALDERGMPCDGAEVDLRVEGGPQLGKRIADSTGRFAFHGLPDLPLILKARVLWPEMSSGLIEVRPEAGEIVIRLVDR